MRVLGAFCAVAMLSVPLAASASGGNNLDLYYLSSGIELEVPGLGSGEDDGDGFGAKGRFAISDALFLSAEYQTAKLDDLDEDLTQIRLGVGGSIPIAVSAFSGRSDTSSWAIPTVRSFLSVRRSR